MLPFQKEKLIKSPILVKEAIFFIFWSYLEKLTFTKDLYLCFLLKA